MSRCVRRAAAPAVAQTTTAAPAATTGSRRRLDEAVLVGDAGRLRAVRHSELPVHVRQVELHRLLGDPELLADLLVREPSGEGAEQRGLPLAQAEVLVRAAEPLDAAVDGELLPGRRRAHRPRDVVGIAGLADEAARS